MPTTESVDMQSSSEVPGDIPGDISDDESEPDIDTQAEDTENFPEYSGYTQNALLERIAGILADIFHEIEKITRTISRKHTLCRRFACAFSDTMLVPDEEDKKAVEAALAKKNIKWEQVQSKSPAWLWKRVCRYIPDKDILYNLLSELFQSWGSVKCSVTKQPLFSAESWKKAQRVLHDVKKGWISDPSNIPLYTLESRDKNGLPIYHCIRGTNSVEGSVHNPIRRKFASLNASPELADALIADFRHRHNYDTGSMHKLGKKYLGHYDPWIDHDILQLRSDIKWNMVDSHTTTTSGRALQDTDPLSFQYTEEQFGITQIPGILQIQNDYNSFAINPHEEFSIYPTKLLLSQLQGKRKSVYEFLANAQRTKYAVVPLHTEDEFKLFHKSVTVGGMWAAPSVVASLPLRRKNDSRIRSAGHIAHVLPAAPHNQPGVSVTSEDIGMDMTVEFEASQIEQPINLSSEVQYSAIQKLYHFSEPLEASSMFANAKNPSTSAFSVPITTASGREMSSHITTPPAIQSNSTLQPTASSSTSQFVAWGSEVRRRRRCAVCVNAGRDGYDCPGNKDRTKCKHL